MSYSRDEVEITLIEAEKKTASFVGIENIPALKEERVKPKIYGLTTVNLLGPFGNFENDSNSDGLADGWINDATLTPILNQMATTTVPHGLRRQRFTLLEAGEGGNYIEVAVVAGDRLFASGVLAVGQATTDTIKFSANWRDISNLTISTDSIATHNNVCARKSSVLTVPENAAKLRLYTTILGPSGAVGSCDGIQLHNLTKMGQLDPVRQQKYGVSTWTELTETQLEMEIPYFDSVQSVNVSGGMLSEITVENRGKNIAKINYRAYMSGASGIPITPAMITNYDILRGAAAPTNLYYGSYVTNLIVNDSNVSWTAYSTLGPGFIMKIKANTNYRLTVESPTNIEKATCAFYDTNGVFLSYTPYPINKSATIEVI